MIDWSGLDVALSLPDTPATVDWVEDGCVIRWWQGEEVVANAEIRVLEDKRVEWTKFWVEFDNRGRGIFTQALKLQDGWFAEHGLGPSVIARNANDAGFYRQAGFLDEGDDGPMMVQHSETSREWISRNG